MTNFHTHTSLCKHAAGMPKAYIAQAAQEGCQALGFSDHCPYPSGADNTWPHMRMTREEADLYMEAVRQAESPFPVYAGFECEYDPRYESWYRDELLGRLKADYLVLGSHWLPRGNEFVYVKCIESPLDIKAYIDHTIDAMRTELYSFLAHPDLLMIAGHDWNPYLAAIFADLIDAAIDLDLPLEINGYGLCKKPIQTKAGSRPPYPVDEFWELAAQKGAAVICCSDAHEASAVIKQARMARDYASRFGLTPIEIPRMAHA